MEESVILVYGDPAERQCWSTRRYPHVLIVLGKCYDWFVVCSVFVLSVVIMFIFFFPFLDIMFVRQQELIPSIIIVTFTRNTAERVGGISGIAGKEMRVLFLAYF